jgi:hypothetical protein
VQEDSTACSYVVHQGNVTVSASGAATPVVTVSSVTYSTGGYGSPFRALPLASGNVLVSVSASTSGMLVFGPVTGGGLQLSCFNYVRPQCVQDAVYYFERCTPFTTYLWALGPIMSSWRTYGHPSVQVQR